VCYRGEGRCWLLEMTAGLHISRRPESAAARRTAQLRPVAVLTGALAGDLRRLLRRDDDCTAPGKPACDCDDPAPREELADALAAPSVPLVLPEVLQWLLFVFIPSLIQKSASGEAPHPRSLLCRMSASGWPGVRPAFTSGGRLWPRVSDFKNGAEERIFAPVGILKWWLVVIQID
jgi:hypothetical protein